MVLLPLDLSPSFWFCYLLFISVDTLSVFQDEEPATNVIVTEKALIDQVVIVSTQRFLELAGEAECEASLTGRQISVVEQTLKSRNDVEHLGVHLACQPCRHVRALCS